MNVDLSEHQIQEIAATVRRIVEQAILETQQEAILMNQRDELRATQILKERKNAKSR